MVEPAVEKSPRDGDENTYRFEAEVHEVLRLVIESLYSNKEVFLRELLSNASDALDRLRFEAITRPELLSADETLKIRIIPDEEAKTLTIWDNGIGMSAEELRSNLGTVARSGSKQFLAQLEEAKRSEVALIGQFGVGFYSAYLVADRVEVVSRAAGQSEAHRWTSEGRETFRIEPAERECQGTSIVLHLRDDQAEYAKSWKIRTLVERYSDYLGYPIELAVEQKPKDGEDDAEATVRYDVVNAGKALWQRSPSEITDEQYEEFYKHLSHDFEPPMAWRHVRMEGTQEFVALLFVPKRRPVDLFERDAKHGVRLHVRRVMVLESSEELLPRWLRFVRGVVDSEDLPLNVSREMLQDSNKVRVIRKQIVKQMLDLLGEIADERPDDYQELWKSFGLVIKEGVHFEREYADKIGPLLRYQSSRGEELVSLAQYKERMPEGQRAIYYLHGESLETLQRSPHIEALEKRGFEILFMTDPIDEWAAQSLREYEGLPLVSAASADLKLPEDDKDDEEKAKADEAKDEEHAELEPLLKRFRILLAGRVKDVRASSRLSDSPACLVVPEGGTMPHLDRMMRSSKMWAPPNRRILELNPQHELIRNLAALRDEHSDDEKAIDDWIELVHDQALLAEGTPAPDPVAHAKRLERLLSEASRGSSGAAPAKAAATKKAAAPKKAATKKAATKKTATKKTATKKTATKKAATKKAATKKAASKDASAEAATGDVVGAEAAAGAKPADVKNDQG